MGLSRSRCGFITTTVGVNHKICKAHSLRECRMSVILSMRFCIDMSQPCDMSCSWRWLATISVVVSAVSTYRIGWVRSSESCEDYPPVMKQSNLNSTILLDDLFRLSRGFSSRDYQRVEALQRWLLTQPGLGRSTDYGKSCGRTGCHWNIQVPNHLNCTDMRIWLIWLILI